MLLPPVSQPSRPRRRRRPARLGAANVDAIAAKSTAALGAVQLDGGCVRHCRSVSTRPLESVERAATPGLPPDVQRCGPLLLDQQIWSWGCDVERVEGNLLLQFGFSRRRPLPGQGGCSQYSIAWGTGEIRLWGWGVLYRATDFCLFLRRYQFAPLRWRGRRLRARITQPAELTGLKPPGRRAEFRRAQTRLAELCLWIAGYERWVINACGPSYRENCLARWPKPVGAHAYQMAEAWETIADRCQPTDVTDVTGCLKTPNNSWESANQRRKHG